MTPETETGALDLSSPVVSSPLDKEHSSCECTTICSTSTSRPAPPALQFGCEYSELDDSSGEDESDEIESNEDDSGEDDSDEDNSDAEETRASSTSATSSSSIPQARADGDLPQHIMDTWASSSSSSSSSSAASSELSEDSEEEGPTLSSEEVRVLSARKEVLNRAEGVGFMASLSDMKRDVATKGKRIGGGGSGEVFELEVVDCGLQEELLSFTVGAGVVLKKFNKVSVMLLRANATF